MTADALLGCYRIVADDRLLHWRYDDGRKLDSGATARALCGAEVDADAAIEGCLAPRCQKCQETAVAEEYDVDEEMPNSFWPGDDLERKWLP